MRLDLRLGGFYKLGMSDTIERLTDAALRPLADAPELRQAAIKMLENMVPPSHPAAAAAIARWEALAVPKHRPVWRRVLALALVLLSAWVLVTATSEGLRYRRVLAWGQNFLAGRTSQPDSEMLAGLNQKEKFRVFGDLSQPTKSGQMRALWDNSPDDPGCFAAYAIKYRADNGEYPPDFLATARRLDPGNAWFTYLAAGALAQKAVWGDIQTRESRRAGEPRPWKIVDPAKLDEALAMLRVANHEKMCLNRKNEFVAARLPLFPQSDQLARWELLVYLSGDFQSDVNLRYLSDAIAAKAWLIGGSGDAEPFKPLLADADGFLRTLGSMANPSPINVLLYKVEALTLYRYFQAAAEKLGLDEEAGRLGKIKQHFDQLTTVRNHRSANDATAMRSGVFFSPTNLMRNQASIPLILADEDLQPGRMVEHLLAARACSLVLWALLGLGLLAVALYRFCLPQAVRCLAQHINALLLPADWAWMLGAGVLLPFAYVTAITRLTPLGGQEWGINALGWLLPAADFLTLGLLLLVVPAWVARWRLGLRAAALGVCPGHARLGWLAVVAGIALVPLFGMLEPPLAYTEARVVWQLALLAPLLLVILSSVVRALAVSFSRQLSRAVVVLTLIPAYACAMLLLMASVPFYQNAQASWQRRDKLSEVIANGSLRCETAVADELLKEVREFLDQ